MTKIEIANQLEYLEAKLLELQDETIRTTDAEYLAIQLDYGDDKKNLQLPWNEWPELKDAFIRVIRNSITRLKGEMHSALYPATKNDSLI